jgi:alkylation response protein AidB-like acyl-CoA dehydrogenase
VRVPAKYLVGEENGGWGLITNQLNHERVTLCSSGSPERTLADVRRWAQDTVLPDGRRVIDQEWVQLNLARVHARLEFLKLANWKVAWSAAEDTLHPADASTVKVFGTEFYLEAYRLLMEILGPRASIKDGSPADVLRGRLEGMVRGAIILTFGGGANELQRDLISMFGLGFPRMR